MIVVGHGVLLLALVLLRFSAIHLSFPIDTEALIHHVDGRLVFADPVPSIAYKIIVSPKDSPMAQVVRGASVIADPEFDIAGKISFRSAVEGSVVYQILLVPRRWTIATLAFVLAAVMIASWVPGRVSWINRKVLIARYASLFWDACGDFCLASVFVGCVLSVAAYIYATLSENERTSLNSMASDYTSTLVQRQIDRSLAGIPADIVAVGDSSCQQGLDFNLLSKQLRLRAESLCTIGYVGPAGYADMVEMYLKAGGRPQKLIIWLNPIQYVRLPAWEFWPAYVASAGQKSNRRTLMGGTHLVLEDLLLFSLIGHPYAGKVGQYYGNNSIVASALKDGRGTVVSPEEGLTVRSFDELVAAHEYEGAVNKSDMPFMYPMNAAFEDALQHLRQVVKAFGVERTLLAIPPQSEIIHFGESEEARRVAIDRVRTILDVPKDNVLSLPVTVPYYYFTDKQPPATLPAAMRTHVNRWARQEMTRLLGAAIQQHYRADRVSDEPF